MQLSLALWLLLLLVVALVAVRYAVKARRRNMLRERERQRRKRPKPVPRAMSSRAEMRAYDDPTTLAGDITTHGSLPITDQSGGVISAPPRVADHKVTRGSSSGTTDTRSRGTRKPGA
jgi:hypothetical protein